MYFRKISIPTPRKVNGNSKGEGGSKAQFFKGKYDTKMEFPEGWGGGFQAKKHSMGGVWIFSGTTHCQDQDYNLENIPGSVALLFLYFSWTKLYFKTGCVLLPLQHMERKLGTLKI